MPRQLELIFSYSFAMFSEHKRERERERERIKWRLNFRHRSTRYVDFSPVDMAR